MRSTVDRDETNNCYSTITWQYRIQASLYCSCRRKCHPIVCAILRRVVKPMQTTLLASSCWKQWTEAVDIGPRFIGHMVFVYTLNEEYKVIGRYIVAYCTTSWHPFAFGSVTFVNHRGGIKLLLHDVNTYNIVNPPHNKKRKLCNLTFF